jgi:hypothetical protein
MRLMIGSLVASLAIAFAVPACAVDDATPEERSESAELTTTDEASTQRVCPTSGFGVPIPNDRLAEYGACRTGCSGLACGQICCVQVTGCARCYVQ